MLTGAAGATPVTVRGVYEDNQLTSGGFLVDSSLRPKLSTQELFNVVFLTATPGVSDAQLAGSVRTAVGGLGNIVVRTRADVVRASKAQVDQLLGLVYALLGLALLIAVLGIVNTLALSVLERTREIGLLRAVGMSRRQLRLMIRLESVVVSAYGAVLGVVVGVGLGLALVAALRGQGVSRTVIPISTIAAALVAALIIGVVAAVLPARRAARLNVLGAISTA